jgi:hypothetical protein
MELEDREGHAWLVCPNGCATECEIPPRKPAVTETDFEVSEPRARASSAGN